MMTVMDIATYPVITNQCASILSRVLARQLGHLTASSTVRSVVLGRQTLPCRRVLAGARGTARRLKLGNSSHSKNFTLAIQSFWEEVLGRGGADRYEHFLAILRSAVVLGTFVKEDTGVRAAMKHGIMTATRECTRRAFRVALRN